MTYWRYFAVGAVLLVHWTGCKADCIGLCGDPTQEVAAEEGDSGVTAQIPNPCELDLNFGMVAIGQAACAPVIIKNVGHLGGLDLAQVNPTLDPEFGLDYGTVPTIVPGSSWSFPVCFQPYRVGEVASTFQIITDGDNRLCPSLSPDSFNQITIDLAGTGAAVDAGT